MILANSPRCKYSKSKIILIVSQAPRLEDDKKFSALLRRIFHGKDIRRIMDTIDPR